MPTAGNSSTGTSRSLSKCPQRAGWGEKHIKAGRIQRQHDRNAVDGQGDDYVVRVENRQPQCDRHDDQQHEGRQRVQDAERGQENRPSNPRLAGPVAKGYRSNEGDDDRRNAQTKVVKSEAPDIFTGEEVAPYPIHLRVARL